MLGFPRRDGRTKPPPGTPLDRSDPLSSGLILAPTWVMGGGVPRLLDATGAQWSPLGSNLASIGSDGGTAIRFPGLVAGGGYFQQSTVTLPSVSATVLLKCRPTSGDTASSFGDSAISSSTFQAHVPYGSSVYWDFGGQSGANRISYTPAAGYFGNWHRMAFRAGTRGMSIWEDGVRKANSTTAVSRTGATAGATLGSWGSGNQQQTDIEQFLIYNRELSDGEIQDWTATPYRMFLGASTRRFFTISSGVSTPRPSLLALLGVG